MRKPFRMATVFTGAAACAAAFAPAAHAGTAGTIPATRAAAVAATATPAVRAGARTVRIIKAAREDAGTEKTDVVPETTNKECGTGTNTWVHAYYPASADHPTPICFGGSLSEEINPPIHFQSWCGGNNWGWFDGYSSSPNGKQSYQSIPFYQGTTKAIFSHWDGHYGWPYHVTHISLSGHSGTDTCPQ